jgi:thiol:disulfide interchange protein DsbD
MRALIALFLLLFQAHVLAQGFPATSGAGSFEEEFLPVEEAYQLALELTPTEDGEQQVRLYWQIADKYYLYRKRFAFELEDEQGVVESRAEMTAGIEREDEYFGLTEVYYHFADVILTPSRAQGSATLTVTSQGCADAGLCYPPRKQRFALDFDAGTIAPVAKTGARSTPGAASNKQSGAATGQASQSAGLMTILSMMLLAFVGGSILNLMPCVFPVLSLKVFSFATGSEHDRHVHGWVYAAGVVSSFLLVAAILIGLQQAGSAVGWGFQLQSPRFVALLAYLFFAMGLALSGLVELGSNLMGVGSGLAEKEGHSGSFFTGVLATVVASPCTAPFMGSALGFAATQPPAIALSIFAALGAGMAAPMLALSYSKALRSKMPRPGPWMETFKQLLAFPLYATAIWLLWVVGRQTSVNTMTLMLGGMLLLAIGLWLWRYRSWVRGLAAASVAAALVMVSSPMLATADRAPISAAQDSGAWSELRLQQLLDAKTPVFVNVTADWCITCMANERSSLSSEEVIQAMSKRGIVYLKADWTNYNAEIAAYLKTFGRNGIPLYLVYSGIPGEPPQILPQLLTPGIILDSFARI